MNQQPASVSAIRPSFISTLFQPDDIIEIRKFQGKTPKGSEWHLAKDLKSEYPRLSRENAAGVTIYFGANPRNAMGAKNAHGVSVVRNLMADFDHIEEADFMEVLRKSPFPTPTVVMLSGHGYHCYWSVPKMTTDQWIAAQKNIIKKFNVGREPGKEIVDPKIVDLPRVMRLPGFKNWKDPQHPITSKIVSINPISHLIETFLPETVSMIDRATKYLESTPGAISGQGGDVHTFTVACRLVNDFGLTAEEGWPLFQTWNQKCQPAWSESDLRKKLDNAMKYHTAPAGKLVGESHTKTKTFQEPARSDRRAPKFDLEKMGQLMQDCTLVAGTTLIWHDKRGCMMKPDAFRLLYNQEGKEWLKSPTKRTADEEDVVFEPGGCKDHQINMFKGYRIKPVSGQTNLIEDHILTLCGLDTELAHWMTAWMAYPLQHPGAKLQTALVIHGDFGTGKNLLFDAYSRLYVPYSIALNQQILDGRFTGWLSQKCFILADEVIANAHQGLVKNRLKALITSSDITIEEKGLPCRREHNHANFVFLSNNDMPLIVDHHDRRYAVIKCDTVMDSDYYTALAGQLIGPGTSEAFLDYLLKYDCQGFHEHSKPPLTDAKKELIDLCRPAHHRFIELWKSGELPIQSKTISAHDLYFVYRCWCESTGEKQYMVSETRFGRDASKHLEKKRVMDGIFYTGIVDGRIDPEEIDRFRKRTLSEKL
jgi:putative DNA primase/helicase